MGKRLQILRCQEGGEIGAVPVILTSFGWPNATKAGHEAMLSNYTLTVVEDGNLDFDVSKTEGTLMRRLRQVPRPTRLGRLPSNLPSLVT